MIGRLITAVLRALQLHKVMNHPKVQKYVAVAKAWYDLQPRKIQLAVMAAVLVAGGVVMFA